MVKFLDSALAAFKGEFDGSCLTASDENFKKACHLYNGMIEKQPALILQCANEDAVSQAVKFAAEQAPRISVKGGGHNLAGLALRHGGITIDISKLRSVNAKQPDDIVRIQGGSRLGDIDRETARFGRAVPLGTVSDTGVGGLALGGGIGWLMPRHGLTCDNLVEAKLILQDGQTIIVNEHDYPDLFWALRGGGGGNFGIVTEFSIRSFPIKNVIGGSIICSLSEIVSTGRILERINNANDADLCAMLTLSDLPNLGDTAALDLCCSDPRRGLLRVQLECSDGLLMLKSTVQEMPFHVFQRFFDSCAVKGLRRFSKSMFLDQLSDELLLTLEQCFRERPSRMTTIFLEEFHGRFQGTNQSQGAFSNRDAKFNLHLQGCWANKEEDHENRAWLEDVLSRLLKFSRKGGSYLNYNSESPSSRAFPDDVLERLKQVKNKYDPKNFFTGTLPMD